MADLRKGTSEQASEKDPLLPGKRKTSLSPVTLPHPKNEPQQKISEAAKNKELEEVTTKSTQ